MTACISSTEGIASYIPRQTRTFPTHHWKCPSNPQRCIGAGIRCSGPSSHTACLRSIEVVRCGQSAQIIYGGVEIGLRLLVRGTLWESPGQGGESPQGGGAGARTSPGKLSRLSSLRSNMAARCARGQPEYISVLELLKILPERGTRSLQSTRNGSKGFHAHEMWYICATN
jgi:hypothetical protein